VDEVIPGILHWKARHPKIGVEVSSYLLTETGTALDPILPEGEGPEWIGRPVERAVLTVRHHLRSASELGVPILAHRSGLHEFEGEDVDVRAYDAGDELAPGVQVLPFGRICPDDAALLIEAGPGVLAFGDAIMNYGGIEHPPDRYLGDEPEGVKREIVEGLKPLLEQDFDALLFAHGDPVPAGGKAMLGDFVAARRR
jgi:glyoxylase-like metal-dependent hydrolase (beta-lactamase superfamily II)